MNSRTSGMLSQMQQRRAERKKPKRFVPLKKVSLDASQQHGISTAQTNIPKHPITQVHVGRSSAALVVAMVFHVLIGIIISAFYIKDRIESEQEIFDISFVREDTKTKRRFQRRETPKFNQVKQEQQQVLVQRPVTVLDQPLSNDTFVIPQGPETTGDLTTSGTDEGPRLIDVNRDFVKPTTTVEPDTKAPAFEIQREAPTLIDKLDTPAPDQAPGLDGISFESEPGVVNPQYKFKVEPKYPEAASKAGKEGQVILQATIDEKGIPRDIKAITNVGFGFEAAAIAALKKTTFRPATKGGNPISLQVEIPYAFTLKDK
ncbi:energy transducer TonB [Candidatus Poribacteria bacterium]|nr:energy transducer TonB [Candidatus Poribacteria bacterium]